ncbi:hypothetical protein GCM10023238_23050 [Streptomyces heliomycini]
MTAVLSLYQRAAAHRSRRLMPVPTKFSVTGEYATRSPRAYVTTLSMPSVPCFRRTAPAASALNVEAYAKPVVRPVADRPARAGVQGVDAEPRVELPLQCPELGSGGFRGAAGDADRFEAAGAPGPDAVC